MSRELRSRLAVGTALTVVMTLPAYAQDRNARPGLTVDPWTGWYVGAGFSFEVLGSVLSGYGSDDYCDKSDCDTISLQDRRTTNPHAFGAELEVGFDRSLGNRLVIGGAVSIGLNSKLGSWHHVSDTYNGKTGTYFPELDYFGEILHTGSVVARVGYEVTPASLVYLLGGVTWAGYRIGGTYDADVGTPFSWSQTGVTHGLTIGAGFERFIGPKTTFKLEYRYTALGGVNVRFNDSPQFGETRFDPTLHSVLAKLTLRLN